MLLMQIQTRDAYSGEESSKGFGVERLWMTCLTFMLISGMVRSISGIMNSRYIWNDRKMPAVGDRRVLLDERTSLPIEV